MLTICATTQNSTLLSDSVRYRQISLPPDIQSTYSSEARQYWKAIEDKQTTTHAKTFKQATSWRSSDSLLAPNLIKPLTSQLNVNLQEDMFIDGNEAAPTNRQISTTVEREESSGLVSHLHFVVIRYASK